jgi:hypothetical protein
MKRVFAACVLMSFGLGVAGAEGGKTPAFGYSSSGSCIASPLGFTSKLQPINPGVSWRTTFNAVGSADAEGKVTEAGQSVDSASFGAGPRMHTPAANAYRDTFLVLLTGPNSDGSSTFQLGMASGSFIAGPNTGVRFTISNFELKGWSGTNGMRTFGSSEAPAIQTVSLSDGMRFQRICTMLIVSILPRP